MLVVTRACGAFGRIERDRAATMARLAGGLTPLLDHDDVALFGSLACAPRDDPAGTAWAWSGDRARPTGRGPWQRAAVDDDACGLVITHRGTVLLHGGVSGSQPLFVEITDDAVYFATTLSWLIESSTAPRRTDWDAWAQILALGAPLAGRTPFAGVSRLRPMEHVELREGRTVTGTAAWPWLAVEPEPGLLPAQLTGDLLDALRARLSNYLPGSVHPMLSGGRDSRLLATLVSHLAGAGSPVTAWTTSSDTGTSMEELVAARVASVLGIDHRLVAPRHDRFPDDVAEYAHAVDYLASFHTWLMPVAQQLGEVEGTVLDGLGGGVFLGGGFPDAAGPAGDVVSARFERIARYLEAGPSVLAPGLTAHVRERSRADYEHVAAPLATHPAGATLTAYLTRTAPGISLAPAKVLGGARPTAMPMMADDVVSLALRLTPEHKADGAWYADLMRAADPRIAALPTAADLTKRRQHVRRGASLQAAEWYRDLIVTSAVAELLSPELRAADAPSWAAQLNKTRPQHLIRGLAVLALWLEQYRSWLADPHIDLADHVRGIPGADRG